VVILLSKARGTANPVPHNPWTPLQRNESLQGTDQWKTPFGQLQDLSTVGNYLEGQVFHADVNDTLPTFPLLRTRLLSLDFYKVRNCAREEVSSCLYYGELRRSCLGETTGHSGISRSPFLVRYPHCFQMLFWSSS
jgi:hypothetical protein